jgi:hypothetical protein
MEEVASSFSTVDFRCRAQQYSGGLSTINRSAKIIFPSLNRRQEKPNCLILVAQALLNLVNSDAMMRNEDGNLREFGRVA